MNYYIVSDESMQRFLKADGEWTDDRDEAEHLTIEQAVERQVELIRKNVVTEICEVPLMHEAIYDDIHTRIDDVQRRLADAGIYLTTEIGSGDETTWTLEVESVGLTLKMRLAGPDEWEVVQ